MNQAGLLCTKNNIVCIEETSGNIEYLLNALPLAKLKMKMMVMLGSITRGSFAIKQANFHPIE